MQINDLFTGTQHTIQDNFLKLLWDKKIPTKVYLRNGIALQGFIEAFDQVTITLKNGESQLVYKSSVATIMPTFGVKNIKQHKSGTRHRVVNCV